MKRIIALIGLAFSLIGLLVFLPVALYTGEFSRDLELALPGVVFWFAVLLSSWRTLERTRKNHLVPLSQIHVGRHSRHLGA